MEVTTSEQLWVEISKLKRRLEVVERQATQLKSSGEVLPEEEFQREFPNAEIDRQWFKLVGILPQLPLEEDSQEIMRAIEEAYRK